MVTAVQAEETACAKAQGHERRWRVWGGLHASGGAELGHEVHVTDGKRWSDKPWVMEGHDHRIKMSWMRLGAMKGFSFPKDNRNSGWESLLYFSLTYPISHVYRKVRARQVCSLRSWHELSTPCNQHPD